MPTIVFEKLLAGLLRGAFGVRWDTRGPEINIYIYKLPYKTLKLQPHCVGRSLLHLSSLVTIWLQRPT